jgi:4-oxalocrotonate tautomerase
MPIIEITLTQGRSPEKLAEMGDAVTHAAAQALDVDPNTIRVLLRELPESHWLVGGRSIAEVRAERARAKGDGQ